MGEMTTIINKEYKYDIIIKFNNGDRIEGSFRDKESALRFLRIYEQ